MDLLCRALKSCRVCVRNGCHYLIFQDFTEGCYKSNHRLPRVFKEFDQVGQCKEKVCKIGDDFYEDLEEIIGGGLGGVFCSIGIYLLYQWAMKKIAEPQNRPAWIRRTRLVTWIIRLARGLRNNNDDEEPLLENIVLEQHDLQELNAADAEARGERDNADVNEPLNDPENIVGPDARDVAGHAAANVPRNDPENVAGLGAGNIAQNLAVNEPLNAAGNVPRNTTGNIAQNVAGIIAEDAAGNFNELAGPAVMIQASAYQIARPRPPSRIPRPSPILRSNVQPSSRHIPPPPQQAHVTPAAMGGLSAARRNLFSAEQNPAVLPVGNPQEIAVGLRQRNSPNRPTRAAASNARNLMNELRRNNQI